MKPIALGIATLVTLANVAAYGVISNKNATIELQTDHIAKLEKLNQQHTSNYLDLSERYDHTRSDYRNLSEHFFNQKATIDSLQQENKQLRGRISRGRGRRVSPRAARPLSNAKTSAGGAYNIISSLAPADLRARLLRIARCESGFNPNAHGQRDSKGYRPTGLFQYKPPTWRWMSAQAGYAGASIYDPVAQTKVTIWAFQNGKSGHWACK
ncbi:MAG: transglycosylase SLT domain-containing protein [Terriglobia bacterium]